MRPDYLEISQLRPAAFSILRSYGIRMCLLERGEKLAVVLGELSDWKQMYSDDQSVVFVRREAAGSVAGGRGLQ